MRTLLIWIIIAGALGAGVLVIHNRRLAHAETAPDTAIGSLGFDPARTVSISRSAGDAKERIDRDPKRPDHWVLHWLSGADEHAWDAESTRVRGGLRALATARIEVSKEELDIGGGNELVIKQQDGGSVRVLFASESSGGYTPIRVESRGGDGIATGRWFGRIEKSVSDAFISTGFSRWRSPDLFDLADSAVRSVKLGASGVSVTLERRAGGWEIVEPLSIHGDRGTIENLVKVLISLEASAFVDDPIDDATTGLASPVATIEIGTTDETRTLTIGSRADVNGSLVYARLGSATDSALVTLKTDQLSKLTPVAEAYIGKVPSTAGPTEVRRVIIRGRDEQPRLDAGRSSGGWAVEGVEVDSINSSAIDRLVALLTRDPAQLVRVYNAGETPPMIGAIELLGKNDAPLGRFTAALDSTDAGMRLLLMQRLDDGRRVLWACMSEDASASGAWLTALASRRAP